MLKYVARGLLVAAAMAPVASFPQSVNLPGQGGGKSLLCSSLPGISGMGCGNAPATAVSAGSSGAPIFSAPQPVVVDLGPALQAASIGDDLQSIIERDFQNFSFMLETLANKGVKIQDSNFIITFTKGYINTSWGIGGSPSRASIAIYYRSNPYYALSFGTLPLLSFVGINGGVLKGYRLEGLGYFSCGVGYYIDNVLQLVKEAYNLYGAGPGGIQNNPSYVGKWRPNFIAVNQGCGGA